MFSIKIQNQNGMHIGDRINVDTDEVKKYIDKGFVVIDISTGTPFDANNITDMNGKSDDNDSINNDIDP